VYDSLDGKRHQRLLTIVQPVALRALAETKENVKDVSRAEATDWR